jgi:hypothetical protein
VNKFYMVGAVFIGIGAVLAYHAGRQDMQSELKTAEEKKWKDAINNTDPDEHPEAD